MTTDDLRRLLAEAIAAEHEKGPLAWCYQVRAVERAAVNALPELLDVAEAARVATDGLLDCERTAPGGVACPLCDTAMTSYQGRGGTVGTTGHAPLCVYHAVHDLDAALAALDDHATPDTTSPPDPPTATGETR